MWHTIVFEIHPAGTVAFVFLQGLLASLIGWITARAVFRGLGAQAIPVAPYFVTVTTLLAIVFAFLAADIWSFNREAGSAARAEIEAFDRAKDAIAGIPVRGKALAENLARHADGVTRVEWGTYHNQRPSQASDVALSRLRAETTRLAAAGLSPAIANELYRAIDLMSEARRTRLRIGGSHGNAYRWSLVVILSIFSHIAVALVHADRPRAIATSLALFSVALSASISVMAIYESPYFGAATVPMPDFPVFEYW